MKITSHLPQTVWVSSKDKRQDSKDNRPNLLIILKDKQVTNLDLEVVT